MLNNLNGLAKKIHDNATEKGFWTEEREGTHLIMVCRELYKFLDAVRKDKKCITMYIKMINMHNDKLVPIFEENIKGTIEEKCANIVIRCLDIIKTYYIEDGLFLSFTDKGENIGLKKYDYYYSHIVDFVYDLNELFYKEEEEIALYKLIAMIDWYCEQHNIDLQNHIEIKMKYNETWPKLQGNKF